MSLCTHCSLCLFILILQVSAPLVTLVPSLYSLHSTMTFILFLCLLSVSTTTIPRTETLWVWYAQCPAQGTQHIAHAQEPLMSNCVCHGLYSRGPPSILCALNSSSPSKTQMSPPEAVVPRPAALFTQPHTGGTVLCLPVPSLGVPPGHKHLLFPFRLALCLAHSR